MAQTPIFQLKTFSDIYTAVREELKIQSTDTTAINRIQRDVNIVYLEEVVPFAQWKWLRGNFDTTVYAAISAGTATATQSSNTVTLTVPIASSKVGWLFGIVGYSEVYRIAAHASNSGTIVLEAPYTGVTNATGSYKIWTDEIYLPSFVRETFEISHDFNDQPLTNCGLQQYRQYVASLPRAEGRPFFYTTNHYYDPLEYQTPAGIPAMVSRSSDTINKTLIFASDVSNYIQQGDRIRVLNAGDKSYNGQFVVASQSGATISYTATVPTYEATISDTVLTVQKQQSSSDTRRAKRILVYPAVFNQNTTLHIDYIKEVQALQNDSDEPHIPIGDRTVLLYGTLNRAWSRERNPEEAERNYKLYQTKLARMAGKMDDSMDQPKLVPNKIYLGSKRMAQRQKDTRNGLPEGWGGGNTGGQVITGTANRAAIFDSTGALAASAVLATEVLQLSGILSKAVGITDTQTLSNKTLLDQSTTIAATGDTTKKVVFSIGSNSSTTTTFSVVSTAARTLTFPDATDTIVARSTTDTLANKSLQDTTTSVVNTSDATKALNFSLSGQTAATTLTLASVITAARTLTFPNATDTLVARTTTDVLTNKTIASSANTITGLTDSTISSSAAISRFKIASSSANWVVTNDANGNLTGVAPAGSGNLLTSNGTSWVSQAVLTTAALSKSANYNIGTGDDTILFTTSSSALSTTLPTAVGASGKRYVIKKVDTGNGSVQINTTSSQTIDTRTSGDIVLASTWDNLTVESDGANWAILQKKETKFVASSANFAFAGLSTNQYANVPGSNITLGVGQWRLYAMGVISTAGNGVQVGINSGTGFYASTGNNTSTPPSALPTLPISDIQGFYTFSPTVSLGATTVMSDVVAAGMVVSMPYLETVITMTASTSIYFVPQVTLTTAGSASMYTWLQAQRLW